MTSAMEILIVEDEMLLVMDIEAIVEDSGHHVAADAASLQEVEALGPDVDFQLAFVDIHLANGSSGLDVSRLIQRRWPNAIIVFVTANVAMIPDDFTGAHGVIAKPFSHAGVMNALRYLADGVFDPPPSIPRPASLVPSPNLEKLWAG
ncbi:MAG: response regulator [Verrucomicrobiaceae bacterium]|nr:MAG: response regulator [Verrucomicrobiaceae bacterium]